MTLSLGRVGLSGPERALPGPERPTLPRDAGGCLTELKLTYAFADLM
jgi:hypothetical protein